MKLVAKSLFGTEEVLAKELEELGARNIEVLKRAVAFQGNLEVLYSANLHLRTALRILHPFYHFRANDENELYRKIQLFDWSSLFSSKHTFSIDSQVYSNRFRHSQFVALKIKDAIVDQFRNKTGIRPSVDIKNPDFRFNVHVSENQFSLSMDSSGDPLFKRGYRKQGHEAPLNEVLAASMLLLSKWDKQKPLTDPMCGSGTLPIEAAMMAGNIPPGIHRKRFGFMNWKNYNPDIWKNVKEEARNNIRKIEVPIMGSDITSAAINLSKEAARSMNLAGEIQFIKTPFEELIPKNENGLLIMNPPYGERLSVDNITTMYKQIGDHLKQHYAGHEAWIISSNRDALKHIGLRPSRKFTLFNGSLECKFQMFSMYSGSKKVGRN